MRAVGRFLGAWIAGALTAALFALIFQTQNVIGRLVDVGAEVSLSERLSMTIYDVIHLGSVYVWFILGGAFVAYIAGLIVYRLAGFGRPIVFAVAGAVAMAVMLWAMKQAFFGVQMIAGARDMGGFIMQMVAGVIGGLVFARLSRPKHDAQNEAEWPPAEDA